MARVVADELYKNLCTNLYRSGSRTLARANPFSFLRYQASLRFKFYDMNLQSNGKLRCTETIAQNVLLFVRYRITGANGSNTAPKKGVPPATLALIMSSSIITHYRSLSLITTHHHSSPHSSSLIITHNHSSSIITTHHHSPSLIINHHHTP